MYSKEEKDGIFRIFVIGFLAFIILSCFSLAVMTTNILFYHVIILCFEIILLFLYFTNRPLIVPDKNKSIYSKILYEMPNYSNNLSLSYCLIGMINILIIFKIMKYNFLSNFVYLIFVFWLFNALLILKKSEDEEISSIELLNVFDNVFKFGNIDNKQKIKEIRFFKYEIMFNTFDFVEFFVNIFQKILVVISLIGLTNLINDISMLDKNLMIITVMLFIILDFILKKFQKNKKQVFHALEMYIEQLQNEISEVEKLKPRIRNLRKRRNYNKI